MVWPLIGGLISAGAGLLGGMMNNNAQKDVNTANIAATEKANAENIAMQKEFAQHGLRWKTEDAKRAGIHPLYAVGAPSVSFAPSSVGSTSMHDPSMGNAISQGGADIGRAIATTQTVGERQYDNQIRALQLERGSLENELLRSQIRRQVVETGPAFPTSGDPSVIMPSTVTAPRIAGHTISVDPGMSDAQDFEDRYGELVSLPAGVGIAVSDLVKHMVTNGIPWANSGPRARVYTGGPAAPGPNIGPRPRF